MAKIKYGDWSKLTEYLRKDGKDKITLSDDKIQEITGSIDKNKPYNIDFTNPNYSIRRRANDAGYDVTTIKSIKFFIKRNN